jgi:hypothetical protein
MINVVRQMRLSDEKMLAVGAISLAIGILIGRFVHFEYAGFSVTDFIEGVLIGLSLVMNVAYLIRKRKKVPVSGRGDLNPQPS